MHWADDASLLLLRYVVRATEGSQLMVLGTYRRTELDPKGSLAAALAELRRARTLHELNLEGLAEGEVATLIAAQSGEPAPTRFTRHVVRRTYGNPFFIEELLRHVDASEASEPEDLDIPDSVKDLLRRRLEYVRRSPGGSYWALAPEGDPKEIEVNRTLLLALKTV